MRKVKKIMDIPEHKVAPINGTSITIDICNVKHTPVHYHASSVEMILCLKGSVSILCNHEPITLKEGEMFAIGFDDLHCMYSDTDNIVVSFYMDMQHMDIPWEILQYTYLACEDNSCEPHQALPLQQIKNYILAAVYTYVKHDTLPRETADPICHSILHLLMEHFDWFNRINLAPNANNELRKRFRDVIAYCITNYRNKLTISQIAQAVHINENYLSQFLHKSGYGGFSNLLGYIRCFEAQYLLLNSELSVIQISDKCGFSDVKYFYRHFKYIWGKTPKEYRQWFVNYIKDEDFIYHYSNKEIAAMIEPFLAEYFTKNILSGHKGDLQS